MGNHDGHDDQRHQLGRVGLEEREALDALFLGEILRLVHEFGGEVEARDLGGHQYIRKPPETFSVAPVMYLAWSEARKTTSSATSSASRPVAVTPAAGFVAPDGALYVLAINKVFRFDNIEDNLDKPGTGVELTDKFNLPDTVHHNWKYADFGPDGKLYIQVGANCNICEINNGIHGQIRRYNPDGTGMGGETYRGKNTTLKAEFSDKLKHINGALRKAQQLKNAYPGKRERRLKCDSYSQFCSFVRGESINTLLKQ